MTLHELIDSRLLNQLADFFPDLCTIQSSTPTQGDSGELTDVWTNLAGHINLPCRKAPAGGREPRLPNITYTVGTHIILIRHYYSTITTSMRVVLDSINYNILAVEFDGDKEMTRLTVEVVT